MSKYIDRLKAKGTDAEKEKQFERDAAKASLQMQANLLQQRSDLERAKGELDTLKSASKLSMPAISEKMDEIESLEKGLARMEQVNAELF